MRKFAIYTFIGPLVFVAIVAAIIFLFPATADSIILLSMTIGGALAITGPILRAIARTGATEAKRLSEARAKLLAHIQNHELALQTEMARSVEVDPFGKILTDKRAKVAAYFLRSTSVDYYPMTKVEAINMIVKSFPVRLD